MSGYLTKTTSRPKALSPMKLIPRASHVLSMKYRISKPSSQTVKICPKLPCGFFLYHLIFLHFCLNKTKQNTGLPLQTTSCLFFINRQRTGFSGKQNGKTVLLSESWAGAASGNAEGNTKLRGRQTLSINSKLNEKLFIKVI